MRHKFILILIFLFLHTTAMAQGTGWIHHTVIDGLPSNKVETMFQDSVGYMWVGTDNGVGRYDGETWETFGLDTYVRRIYGLFEDSGRTIWAYGAGGVWRYDGTRLERLLERGVSGLFDDSHGRLWAYGEIGVWRYDGTGFERLLETWVSGLFDDSHGRLWAYGYGVWRYDNTSFQQVVETRSIQASWKLFEDVKKTVWIYGPGGLWQDDGDTLIRFLSEGVTTISSDSQEHLYFHTAEKGVVRSNGNAMQRITSRDGLAEDSIEWIYEDRDGTSGSDRVRV